MASNDTWFLCFCNQRLETTDDVDVHDKSWLALGHDKRCRYPGCTIISPQTSNAKRHWRTHLPDRLGKYFCSKCDASYVKPEALKKHEAAVICRKNRRRCRSVFEEDAALVLPSITSRNDMSSPGGHTTESETLSQALPKDTSTPSTTTAPLSTMAVQHSRRSHPDRDFPAPTQDGWNPPRNGTQAGPAEKRSKERAQVETAPPLRSLRGSFSQTIPPKDALLGHTDTDQPALLVGQVFMRPPNDDYPEVLVESYSQGDTSSLWSRRERATSASYWDTGSSVAPMVNRLLSPFRKSSMSDKPSPSSQEENKFYHALYLEDTRTHTCMYHGCTRRVESQQALQIHTRMFHHSQAHNDMDSSAESSVASLSPRSLVRPGLRRGRTPDSLSQFSKNYFVIDRSQEFQLLDLRMERVGRGTLELCVTLEGSWESKESLLNDLTKSVRFISLRPTLASLWRAITKTITTRPPGIPEDMSYLHIDSYAVEYESLWLIVLEWTEEGIVGRWRYDGSGMKPVSDLKYVTVVELS
jgi:hypothetical protein